MAYSNVSKKVLLMGRAGAGKTSMRSIIFANYLARDTKRLSATNNVEHSHLKFLGNLVLSLWDCGGQDTFMENYFESQRDHIFRNAEVLIYVLEARSSTLSSLQLQSRQREVEKDFHYLRNTMYSIKNFSPTAKIFLLVHKMDLVKDEENEGMGIVNLYTQEINQAADGLCVNVFPTSIWDETLFRAWSAIVYSLLPNVAELNNNLMELCTICQADEIVMFEKSTFLVISHATRKPHQDGHRYEKVSNICKQFKLTCGKTQSNFTSLTVQGATFRAFIERFTANTFIMVVSSDQEITPAATLCNIDYARENFEKIAESMQSGPTL
eukprot:GHVS01053688.1.p1 GENE.GHVS01053688.1~~GHVS01053688.1.p1  ORF type:complete len:325 (+),score=22.00 GHVS01053688.1:332-1306(+)